MDLKSLIDDVTLNMSFKSPEREKKQQQEISRQLCEENQMNEELTGKIKNSNQASICSLEISQFESEIQKLKLKLQILPASRTCNVT